MRILNGVPFDIASLPEDRPARELFVLINQQNPEQPVIRFGFPPESDNISDVVFHLRSNNTWEDHEDNPKLLTEPSTFQRVTVEDLFDLMDELKDSDIPRNRAIGLRALILEALNDITANNISDTADGAEALRQQPNNTDDEDAAMQAQALLNELEIEQELDAGSAEAAD